KKNKSNTKLNFSFSLSCFHHTIISGQITHSQQNWTETPECPGWRRDYVTAYRINSVTRHHQHPYIVNLAILHREELKRRRKSNGLLVELNQPAINLF
ncbi:TPA: hypothetical protein ACJGP3_003677, partial [Salmonella enterica subsp. enterica serovar Agona]